MMNATHYHTRVSALRTHKNVNGSRVQRKGKNKYLTDIKFNHLAEKIAAM